MGEDNQGELPCCGLCCGLAFYRFCVNLCEIVKRFRRAYFTWTLTGLLVSLRQLYYIILSHNSPDEKFCSMAHYMQNHLSFEKIKGLAREYFLYLIQT
jgi:hypothetical protein